MNTLARTAKHKLTVLRDMASKRVIKQFAAKYHFVYFGRVDARDDEHTLVRGLTASTSHQDNHYTVGSFKNRDVIVLERRNTVTFPSKESRKYAWIIMQFDLRRSGLPHIFIDAHHHEGTFFANLAVTQPYFKDMTAYFSQQDAAFGQQCTLFASPSQYQEISQLLPPDVTATISRHLHQFDYEIDDDRLLVYASNAIVTPHALQDMLRAGTWFAEVLDR